jgi:S1-C subfamily serine protease
MKFIALLLMLSFAVNAAEPMPAATFEVTAQKGDKLRIGTAFYISDTQLLTAAHTVKDWTNVTIKKNGVSVPCKIIRVDPKLDICLLECEPNGVFFVLQPQRLRAFGFIKGQQRATDGFVTQLKSTNDIYLGQSGEPVLDEDNRVVGMGVSSDGDNHNCYMVPAAVLDAFVRGDAKELKRAKD